MRTQYIQTKRAARPPRGCFCFKIFHFSSTKGIWNVLKTVLTTMPVFLIGWHCFLHICEPRRISGPHFSLPDRKYVFVRRLMAGRHSNNIASHFEVSYMKLLIQNIEEKFHRLYNKCEGILTSLRADVSCFFPCTLFPQTTMESGVARRLLSYPLCFFSLFRTPQSVLWIELPGPWRLAERQKQ